MPRSLSNLWNRISSLTKSPRTTARRRPERSSKTRLRRAFFESLEERRVLAIDVAVVGDFSGGDQAGFIATRDQLNDDTYFDFNATLVNSSQVDTLAELSAFDVVLVGSNGHSGNNALSNLTFTSALRSWVEIQSGGVVMTGWGIAGAGANSDINAIIPVNTAGGYDAAFASGVSITNGAHLVTQGVSSFSVAGFTEYPFTAPHVDAGGTILGTTGGRPTVVANVAGNGRGIYLGPTYGASTSYFTGDLRTGSADRLLEQAVAWLAEREVVETVYPFAAVGGTLFSGAGQSGLAGGRTNSYNFASNPSAPYFDNGVSFYWVPSAANMGLSGGNAANLRSFNSTNLISLTPTTATWLINNVPFDLNGGGVPDTTIPFGRLTLNITGAAGPLLSGALLPPGINGIGVALPVQGNFNANFIFEVSTDGATYTPADAYYSTFSTGTGGSFKNFSATGYYNNAPTLNANHLAVGTANNGSPDAFVLHRIGGDVEMSVNGTPIFRLPETSLAGLTINGSNDDDTLTVDLSGGDPIPAGGITFNGGAGSDALSIVGGSQGNVTYNYTNANDGNIVMANFGTVTYTGLEPITNTGTAADVIFNLPATASTVTLGDDGTSGNGLSRLSSSPATFELTNFANPTGSLTINRGNAADTITVDSLPDFTAALTIGSLAVPFATGHLAGAINLAAGMNLNVFATTANVASTAAVAVSGAGAVNLRADNLNIQAGAALTAAGTVAIAPITATRHVDLGTSIAAALSLTDAELDQITAGVVQISSIATAANVFVTQPITHGNSLSLSAVGQVVFQSSIAMEVDNDLTVTGAQGVSLQGSTADLAATGSGAITLTTPGFIQSTGSGPSIATQNGNLTLEANQQATQTPGSFHGVYLENAVVESTGSGIVSVKGRGGQFGGHGVVLWNGATIRGGTTGTTIVSGSTGTNTGSVFGLFASASTITSNGSNVSLTGISLAGANSGNYGLLLESNSLITAGGSGTVTVQGIGSTAASGNFNVGAYVYSSTITSSGGNVSVTGTGGGSTFGFGFNYGVYAALSTVTAMGIGTVTVSGAGGAAAGNRNIGVVLEGSSAQIISSGGSVSVTGTGGGTGSSYENYGVALFSAAKMQPGGTGALTVQGAGGLGNNGSNHGIYNNGGTLTAAGNISLTGSSNGGGSSNYGVYQSSGTTSATGSGTLTIQGTGGGASGTGSSNYGTYLTGALSTANGDLSISGQGGSGSGGSNFGASVGASTSVGGMGALTVEGTGGTAGGGNYGLNTFGTFSTNDGDIRLTGLGGGTGSTSNNIGAQVFSTFIAGGSGDVMIEGTGGATTGSSNFGIFHGANISTTSGDIEVKGQGGGIGSGGSNYGTYLNGGILTPGGAGSLTIEGTGGEATGSNNYGVYVANTTTANRGTVTGIGGGSGGTSGANHGVYVASVLTTSGTFGITVNGTGGSTGGNDNNGVFVAGGFAQIYTAGSATVTGQGGGSGASANNYGVAVDSSNISSSNGGAITVNGTGGATTGSGNTGVFVRSGSIGFNNASTVTVTGNGGGSSGAGSNNHGVSVTSSSLGSNHPAAVTVTGTGGAGSGGTNHGVFASGSTLGASGAGSLTVQGTGGASAGNNNYGIVADGSSYRQFGGTGNLLLVGQGGGTGSSAGNVGVYFTNAGRGISNSSGTVNITGTGGSTTGAGNHGVSLMGGSQIFNQFTGAVNVTGTGGGAGSAAGATGVYLQGASRIEGSHPATAVNISGTGGAGTGTGNYGVDLTTGSFFSINASPLTVNAVAGGGSAASALRISQASMSGGSGSLISIHADSADIGNSGGGGIGGPSVAIRPLTAGAAIDLGGPDAAGTLGLSDAELDRISTATLQIGGANSGAITISGPINPANTFTLSLVTGSRIVDGNAAGNDLSVANLTLQSVTGIGAVGDAVEIAAATLDVQNSTSGNLWLAEADAITVNRLTLGGGSGWLMLSGHGVTIPSGSSGLETVRNLGSGRTDLASPSGGGITIGERAIRTNGQLILSTASQPIIVTNAAGNPEIVSTGEVEIDSAAVGSATNPLEIEGAISLNINDAGLGNIYIAEAVASTIANTRVTVRGAGFGTIDVDYIGSDVVDINDNAEVHNAVLDHGFSFSNIGVGANVRNIDVTTGGVRVEGIGADVKLYDNAITVLTSGNVLLFSTLGGRILDADGGTSAAVSTPSQVELRGDGGIGSSSSPITVSAGKLLTTSGNADQYLAAASSIPFTGTSSAGNATIHLKSGTFTLDAAERIDNVTKLNVNGATFDIGSANETVGTLTLTSGGIAGTTGILTSTNTVQTHSGSISAILGGSSGLTQSTAGTTTLTAANVYTGPTTIEGGVLVGTLLADGGVSSSLGASSNAAANLVLNGGTLRYTGTGASTDRLFSVGTSGGTIDYQSAGYTSLSFTNPGSIGFNTQSGPRTLTITGNHNTIHFNPALSDQGGATSLTVASTNFFAGDRFIFGNNTHSGPTTISGTSLWVYGTGTLGSGSVSSASSGSLVFAPSVDQIVSNTIAGNLSVTKTSIGSLTLSGVNSYTGQTAITSGVLIVDLLANTGTNSNLGTGSFAFDGILFNGGTLRYTGPAVSIDRLISVGVSGATIDASGSGPLSITRTAPFGLTNGPGARTLTLTGTNTGENSIASVFGDSAGISTLVKSGSGSWRLDANNTYTGVTNVHEGQLLVNGSLADGPATFDVLVASGAILGGKGAINGDIQASGKLSPGASPGKLTAGDTTFVNGSNFEVEIGGTTAGNLATNHDQLVVNGAVSIGTNVALSTLSFNGFVPVSGDKFTILSNDDSDSVVGRFQGLSEGAVIDTDFLGSGLPGIITYRGGDGNDIAILVGNTTVAITGGDLVIADAISAGKNDTLSLKKVTVSGVDYLEIHDPVNYPAGAGFIQVDAHTVRVPLASITGTITINSQVGDDTLTIDYSGGDPLPAGGLTFDGGAGGNDTLAFTGAGLGSATLTHTSANDGSVVLDGKSVTYTGLDPILIDTPGANWVLEYSSDPAPVTLAAVGSDLQVTRSGVAEQVTISPAGLASLTIRTGAGADTVELDSLPTGWSAAISLEGQGGADILNVNTADVSSSGSITTIGIETANLSRNITAASLSGDAASVIVDDAPSGQIQDGIDLVAVGGAVLVQAGTYSENVVVNKQVVIDGKGAGANPAIHTIVDGSVGGVAASALTITGSGASAVARLVIQDLHIQGTQTNAIDIGSAVSYVTLQNITADGTEGSAGGYRVGVWMHGSGQITDLKLDGVRLSGFFNGGIYVDAPTPVNGFELVNSELSHNRLGLHTYANPASTTNENNFTNVVIRDNLILDNAWKGLYFEKLNNAVIERNTIEDSGIGLPSPAVLFSSGNGNAGVEFNLKYGNYSNIDVLNNVFDNSGVRTGTGTDVSGALAIKPRNDAPSYSANPATLNDVVVSGNIFQNIPAPGRAILIGETGKNTITPTNLNITGNLLSDGSFPGLVNSTAGSVNAEGNWWGTNAAAGVVAKVGGPVDFDPWLALGTDTSAAFGYQPNTAILSSVSGGTVISGTANNDAITVTVSGGATIVTVNSTVYTLDAIDGLVINGGAGSDTVTVIGPIGKPVTFNGETGASDSLRISATGQDAVYTPSATTFGDGVIAFGGSTIVFTGLEPIDFDFVGGTFTLSLPGADDVVDIENSTLLDGVTPALKISGSTGSVGFENARVRGAAIVIDTTAVAGNDDIEIISASVAHTNASLTISAGNELGDVITINGTATFAGLITLNASTINFNANVTGAVTGNTASVVNVDEPGQIQDAVDVAAAGATVNVAAGFYTEAVVVNKTLTLLGARAGVHGNHGSRGVNESVIQTASQTASALVLNANDVRVDGFTVVGPNSIAHGAAIALADGIAGRPAAAATFDNTLLENNRVFRTSGPLNYTGEGIYLVLPGTQTASTKVTIEDNYFGIGNDGFEQGNNSLTLVDASYAGAYSGWTVGSADRYIASGNRFVGHGKIYVDQTVGVLIDNNDFAGAEWGAVEMRRSRDTVISNNNMTGVTDVGVLAHSLAATGAGVVRDLTITGNSIDGIVAGPSPQPFDPASGIILGGVENATVANNFIRNSAGSGVVIGGPGYTHFPAGWGLITQANPVNNVIFNNDLSGNGLGVKVDGTVTAGTPINASGNWWGSNAAATVKAQANGGVGVDYTPWLHTGADLSGAVGFQGDFSVLNVDDDSAQAGSTGRIQEGVNLVTATGTVNVLPGIYTEDVTVTKSLQLLGAGPAAGGSIINGAIGGPGTTVTIAASNVELAGFTISRDGNNTTDWNNPGLNSAGVAIQGTVITGATIHDNTIIGNRTGIDINNSNGHMIRNNRITDNRTGLIFRNQTDDLIVEENEITNNWTVGVLFLDASGGTNSPVQSALNSTFRNNDLSGNWYGAIVDRQSGGSLPAPGTTNLKNFSGNWFGTAAPVITTANSAEPGYAAQIPVLFGGTATPPGGQPEIAGSASANFDVTPWLNSGTDTNVETVPGRGTFGFQGSTANLTVTAQAAQVGLIGRIQEGINLVTGTNTVHVLPGSYSEDVLANKSGLDLLGGGPATTTISGPIGGDGATIRVAAVDVEVAGFTITRAGNNATDWNNPGLNTAGVAIQSIAPANLLLRDNVISGNRSAIDVNNSSTLTIRNNVIDGNHTGVIFRNVTDNITFVENAVTNNRTVGILFLDASGGTNFPLQTALNSVFTNNNISGNWYGGIVDRQAGGSLPAPGTTNLKNFSGNWFGTPAPTFTTANSGEPGYAALMPVAFGGSATPPGGQPDIAGPASANFDVTPWLNSGVDTNVETVPGRGTFGFQGSTASLTVSAQLAQTGLTPRIQEGINLVTAGGTVVVQAGTYSGDVDASPKAVTLQIGSGDEVVTVNGNSTLGADDTLAVEINGNTAGTYDQLIVNGTVSLGDATLQVTGAYTPTAADVFTLIDNNLADPVSGTFAGLPGGSLVDVNGFNKQISYIRGDGNDVVLFTPTIQFSQPTFTVNENGTIVSAVTLTRDTSEGTSQVQITFPGTGTATAGDDYNAAPITVTFTGTNSETVSMPVVNDLLSEGLETAGLVVVASSNARIGAQGTATLNILDNDIDLKVTKVDSVDPVSAPSAPANLTYTVTVKNVGQLDATGIELSDLLTLPAGVSVVSVTPSQGSISPPAAAAVTNYTWALGSLAVNAPAATLTIVVAVDPSAVSGVDVISNTATVTAANENLVNTDDDSDTEATSISAFDFGDAPASYGTALANAARHSIGALKLGASVDAELNGQPTQNANGDDLNGDDENGITLPSSLIRRLDANFIVNAPAGGVLDAWIDFNLDGNFDANERVASGVSMDVGNNTLVVSVPDGQTSGTTYARFRISTAGINTPNGLAADGEVEDYAISLVTPMSGGAEILPDPQSPGKFVLVVNGNNSALFGDAIVVKKATANDVIVFMAPKISFGAFPLNSFDRIVIFGRGGNDSIVIESSIDKPSTIYGDAGNDTISGGSGPDIIVGGDGNDTMTGNAGDDVFIAGLGKNTLTGGAGYDRLVEIAGGATVTSSSIKIGTTSHTYASIEQIELQGTPGNDVFTITGVNALVLLDAGAGNDTLVYTGDGDMVVTDALLTRTKGTVSTSVPLTSIEALRLNGGNGNDTFNLTGWTKSLILGGGGGTDTVIAANNVDYTLSDAALQRTGLPIVSQSAVENAQLTGGASDNRFNVSSWTKAATLAGGAGFDTLVVTDNAASMTLSSSSLTRTGRSAITHSGFEAAELTGGTGNNTISAATFTGQVRIDGAAGNDTLTGGAGPSLLLGGLGNDTVRSGSGRTVQIGGVGLDKLTGSSNDDLLIAGQTVHDANAAALALILAEWASAASYTDRVAHLTGTPGGLNGSLRLDGSNVIHDNAVDVLLGGLDDDLFFAKQVSQPGSPKDTFTDKAPGESIF